MRRSDQRKQAVFALYQHDLTGRELEDLFDDSTTDFARALALETLDRQDELDARIRRHIKAGWTLERIAPLERSILRVAVHELDSGDVPREVAVDEAVELAKRYCSAEAPKFVNGILGAVLRQLGGVGQQPAGDADDAGGDESVGGAGPAAEGAAGSGRSGDDAAGRGDITGP